VKLLIETLPTTVAGCAALVGIVAEEFEGGECPPSAPMRQIQRIEEGRISGSS
jgi:hypothetical protein